MAGRAAGHMAMRNGQRSPTTVYHYMAFFFMEKSRNLLIHLVHAFVHGEEQEFANASRPGTLKHRLRREET